LLKGIFGEKNLRDTESCGYTAETNSRSKKKRVTFFVAIFTF